MEKFEGATTALITPLGKNKIISWDSLENLVEYQINNGIHNLLACGTTGQGPTLDWDEHEKIITRIKEKCKTEKVPIIAGCGSNNTEEANKATKMAFENGADATLHLTGYYNMPSQLGIVDYFSEISESTDLPLIMYDVRSRGHPPYEPATRIYLAKNHKNIIGIKDSSGDKKTWVETRKIAKENGLDKHSFKIISGNDPDTYEMIANPEIEGIGSISVWSNIFPHVYSKEMELLLDGKNEEAKEIDSYLKELNSTVSIKDSYKLQIDNNKYLITNDKFKNPEPVQYAAYVMGMTETPILRSPLGSLKESGKRQVKKVLGNLYGKREDWFEPVEEFYSVKIADRLK